MKKYWFILMCCLVTVLFQNCNTSVSYGADSANAAQFSPVFLRFVGSRAQILRLASAKIVLSIIVLQRHLVLLK